MINRSSAVQAGMAVGPGTGLSAVPLRPLGFGRHGVLIRPLAKVRFADLIARRIIGFCVWSI